MSGSCIIPLLCDYNVKEDGVYRYNDVLLLQQVSLDNAFEEWRSVTPHEDDQTVKNFKFSMEEWLNA
jgi:hypothetical protein